MAVHRLRLANPQPLVTLQYHAYQDAFMQARRLRICAAGHTWTFNSKDALCPDCHLPGYRAYQSLLLRAGRRGGKTRIGALAAIEELTVPGTMGWCAAPTYPKLNDYVLPAFFKQIPQSWLNHKDTNWSESELTLTLPNRSVVVFRSLEDPDAGRGPGLDFLWWDEICEGTLKHWETIAPALADKGGVLLGTTSPRGEDWVHDAFYKTADEGIPGSWACTFTTLDNPWMRQPAQRAYVERQRRLMTDAMFRQEFLAEIVTFTGAIYGDLVDACVIDGSIEEIRQYVPEWPSLNPERKGLTGLDPGTDHPFAGVQLVPTPRGLIAIGEYEQRNQVFQLHATYIKAMQKGLSSSRVAIDRSQAQATIELAQYGLFAQAAENDVIAGINRVSSWMLKSKATRLTSLDLPRGLILPKSLVPTLIKRLRSYRWAENDRADGSTKRELVYKKQDDLPDALRYALMLYPTLPDQDPAAEQKGRDLAGVPEHTRREIEIERRSRTAVGMDEYEALDEPTPVGMGDFNESNGY